MPRRKKETEQAAAAEEMDFPAMAAHPMPKALWARSIDAETVGTRFGHGKKWLGRRYSNHELRQRARDVYATSTVAGNIVRRLKDTVWNTGLAFESSPIWDMIPNAPESEEDRYTITKQIETLWRFYNDRKEIDVTARMNGDIFQGFLGSLGTIEGECFLVLRYLNSPDRIAPLAVQVLNPDQVVSPFDTSKIEAVKATGGDIIDGIEYDSNGREIAIWVVPSDFMANPEPVRIAYFGPKSGRRFVIHWANIEGSEQKRGISELEQLCYELQVLDDYYTAELDGSTSASKILGSIEAQPNVPAGKQPEIKPMVSNAQQNQRKSNSPEPGINEVAIGNTSLILNTLYPGYTLKHFSHNRPNQNFDGFVSSLETRYSGQFGMPHSVFRQQFNASYSAARAEILFYWMSVETRRKHFVTGVMQPIFEQWFTEMVKANKIKAPGFMSSPEIKQAWLNGSFVGVSRPVVDPVKEANAVKIRLEMMHTTNERESKAFNGSDFTENVNRLKVENEKKRMASPVPLPDQSVNSGNPPPDQDNHNDKGNQSDQNNQNSDSNQNQNAGNKSRKKPLSLAKSK